MLCHTRRCGARRLVLDRQAAVAGRYRHIASWVPCVLNGSIAPKSRNVYDGILNLRLTAVNAAVAAVPARHLVRGVGHGDGASALAVVVQLS